MNRNQAILKALQAISMVINGGKGSGNFGHTGRLGKVGGSGSGGSSAGSTRDTKKAPKQESGKSSKIAKISETAKTMASLNRKLDKAKSASEAKSTVDKLRDQVTNYLEANGGNVENWKKLEEAWVGNNYKPMEDAIKNGNHKELNLMRELQQEYFRQQGIKEITLHRGIYNAQAKKIKDQLAKNGSAKLEGDYAASFTEYKESARDYADGAAFSAPDKISHSVVVSHKFKTKDVVYSTYISTFYAGNGGAEFVTTFPKGLNVDKKNVEVLK